MQTALNRHRTFYVLWSAIIIVLILIRYISDSTLTITLMAAKLLDGLIVSVLIGLFVTGFSGWLAKPDEDQDVLAVDDGKLRHELELAREKSHMWHFKGGTGTYTRARTIPDMAKIARRTGPREIRIEILDPFDDRVCEAYSSYRRGLGADSKASDVPSAWTKTRVKRELFATIIAAYLYQLTEPQISIFIGLSGSVSAFRYDCSSESVVITTADSNSKSLLAKSGTPHYHAFLSEVELSWKQCQILNLNKIEHVFDPNNYTSITSIKDDILDNKKCEEILCLFFPNNQVNLDEEDLKFIQRSVLHPKDYYSV